MAEPHDGVRSSEPSPEQEMRVHVAGTFTVRLLPAKHGKAPRKPPVQPAPRPHHIPDGWPLDPIEFGQAVRAARKAADLTQLALANKVGVTEMTIRNVETARCPTLPKTRAWIVAALAKSGQSPPTPKDKP